MNACHQLQIGRPRTLPKVHEMPMPGNPRIAAHLHMPKMAWKMRVLSEAHRQPQGCRNGMQRQHGLSISLYQLAHIFCRGAIHSSMRTSSVPRPYTAGTRAFSGGCRVRLRSNCVTAAASILQRQLHGKQRPMFAVAKITGVSASCSAPWHTGGLPLGPRAALMSSKL